MQMNQADIMGWADITNIKHKNEVLGGYPIPLESHL